MQQPVRTVQEASRCRAELLSDTAVYRRTRQGQRALLNTRDGMATTSIRILARVNGYTELRRLIDLAPDEAHAIGAAIVELVERGLIELCNPDR